jgi:hypothetical protein
MEFAAALHHRAAIDDVNAVHVASFGWIDGRIVRRSRYRVPNQFRNTPKPSPPARHGASARG